MEATGRLEVSTSGKGTRGYTFTESIASDKSCIHVPGYRPATSWSPDSHETSTLASLNLNICKRTPAWKAGKERTINAVP